MLSTLLVIALAAAAGPRAVPAFGKEPRIDGVVKDFGPALEIKSVSDKALSGKVAFKKDVLYVAAHVDDHEVNADDEMDVTLFFPGAGTTARGYIYRVGESGKHAPQKDDGLPDFAFDGVKAAAQKTAKGLDVELSIPARSLPRFNASGPLVFTLCFDYFDTDATGAPAQQRSCVNGDMAQGPLKLPDDFRKGLKLSPPPSVEAIEARKGGWVGFAVLHYPAWAQGDDELTDANLGALVTSGAAVDPAKVDLPAPPKLRLPDGGPLLAVFTGRSPYVGEECKGDQEVRLALYRVNGKTAERVLEWPAASCSWGRAMRYELTGEGNLSIGYTNGATAHFTWSGDHFERSELGRR